LKSIGPLVLRKEDIQSTFESQREVLRRIFRGIMLHESENKTLYIEERHNLYFHPNIVKFIKSRRIEGAM
jgi:hypothetical protein